MIVAIGSGDKTMLSLVAGGMIAIAVVSGVLGVVQTLLSNQVGQRVMHDLRAKVFRHLQRLSLAFFTRTRTGEVQSRISNDIGGVQSVVTNTATSIASNVTSVVATMVGMLLLSWQLALFAFALIPLFAFLRAASATSGAGSQRRRRRRSPTSRASCRSRSRVSGILLGKTMGRTEELADRFERDSLRLADLEVRQRMAGRWVMASIQTSFSIMPAAIYWIGGLTNVVSIATIIAFTTLQTRLFFPVGSLLGVRSTCRRRSRCSIGSSSTSTSASTSPKAPSRCAAAGDVVFDSVWFRYSEDAGRCKTSRSSSRPARRRRSSARPDRARRHSGISRRVSTTSIADACRSEALTYAI